MLTLRMNVASALKVSVSTTSGLLDYTTNQTPDCNHGLVLSAEFAKPDLPEWLARLIEAGRQRSGRPVHLFLVP